MKPNKITQIQVMKWSGDGAISKAFAVDDKGAIWFCDDGYWTRTSQGDLTNKGEK